MGKQIKGIKINNQSTVYDLNVSDIVTYVTAPNGKDFVLKVDDEGNLYTVDETTIPSPGATPTTSGLSIAKLYINEFYCGGLTADEHTLNYCSHNFVELANLTNKDINLHGLSLQYAPDSTKWDVLPLEGVIRAGSTFLIRGAQCSMLTAPTMKINVDSYDMEWYNEEGKLKTFESETSVKFYLTFNVNKYTGENPYNVAASACTADAIGYVDLVGVKGAVSPGGFEGAPYAAGGGLSNKKLFKKYYAMDPVKQATKAIDARNNTNDWCYIDLTKESGELIPSIEVYRPMASYENKDIFYNKTKLRKDKPSMITCSFGIQATDEGNGATRCFNWLTGNLDDKYIWIRTKNSATWDIVSGAESFYANDGRSQYTSFIYDRIMKEYTGGEVIIANKFIVNGLSAGEYEYVAGKKNADGTPNLEGCTDVRSFTVRANVTSFKFVQTSDQQGFNWDEYKIWEAAAKTIVSENSNLEFMINTGDMTQNGNRLGEWLDYFNGKAPEMNNMEEMATIGNNDLSLNVLYKLGGGEDNDKLWHENITFFYTFEADPNNMPIFQGFDGNDYYIPSLYSFNYGNVHFLCLNSEIKKTTETNAYGYNFGDGNFGNFYPQIKTWCENDIAINAGANWNIAYCHEMPFTILTPDKAQAAVCPTTREGGSNANENFLSDSEKYWFSEFCQTNNIPIVLGGHKHTQSTSRAILENVSYEGGQRVVDSMHPIIVVNSTILAEYSGATSLVDYNGYRYPDSWFENGELKDACKSMVQLCTFAMEDDLDISGLTPVTYCMSQATGYKHTSNKELPSLDIPWLRYYFPASGKGTKESPAKVNAHQKFPFFTVWEIGANQIEGKVRKVYGALNSKGKFDINIDGPYTLNGYCATDNEHNIPIHSINGITNMTDAEAETDTRTIIISK